MTFVLKFRSPSPLDGNLSAPPSPSAQPQQNSVDSYLLSQQAMDIQNRIEQLAQLTMV